MEPNTEINNKILNCIINICEQYYPRYHQDEEEIEAFISLDYFGQPLKKYFSSNEIETYEAKEQIIHSYEQFIDDNLFYKIFLNDFKMYMRNNLLNKKRVLLSRIEFENEGIFNNNISFIYYYNFALFMKYVTNKFPELISENIYKIDLILLVAIFSPDYKATFENGVLDKFGTNYEVYTILMLELIDLIKDKKYKGYEDLIEIEKYEFQYPKKWENIISIIEGDILRFLLFYSEISLYSKIRELAYKVNPNFPQVTKMYNKFKKNNNLDFNLILNILNDIIKKILESKTFDEKKNIIKEILNNKLTDEKYKLLNDYEILINLEILSDFYTLNKNGCVLQTIHFMDLLENLFNANIKQKFKFSSFLDFIRNRTKIIEEMKNAKNYIIDFQNILSNKNFRNKMRNILNSPIINNYYKKPKYYNNGDSIKSDLIGKKKFIEIYKNFIRNYIENDKIYERIIFKRMPYGVKGGITPYLCFIIDPFAVNINNNLINKSNYLETYLIILFIHETNHFSKRSYFINKPLSICQTPKNYEGGDCIIHNIFGKEKINIIDIELCNLVNNIKTWESDDIEEIKKFKENLKNIIRNNYTDNEEELIKIKNDKNCLICFFNFRSPKRNDSKISYSRSNGGLFCF